MAFCTDDREPEHVADDGHINAIVRDAVALGARPEDAIVMASLNPATYHGLTQLGAIAPGKRADILVLGDLESFRPERVLKRGRPLGDIPAIEVPDWVKRTVHMGAISAADLVVPWRGGRARVIGLVPDQIITAALEEELTTSDGVAVADPARDLAKIAVFERHLQTGRVGLGFVHGFGLERGAFGSTVAHDAHNVVVVGADDASILTAANRLRDIGGGLVVAGGDRILAELPLPVAGLLSDRPLAEVLDASRKLARAIQDLGVSFPQPVQMLAFLSLSVIPALKITDRGLVDVERFELVPLAT
jgi:adenine deaminase